ESQDSEYPHATLPPGMLARQTQTSDFVGSMPALHREGGGEASLLTRIMSSLAALVSTGEDKDSERGRPKSRIEDMLESYYEGQGREVPWWVHDPPPDPPVVADGRAGRGTGAGAGAETTDESQTSSVELGRDSSTRPSTRSNTGVLRSFARLNIGRLARSQTPRSRPRESASPGAPAHAASEGNSGAPVAPGMGARLRRMLPPQLAGRGGLDSGFGSPALRGRAGASNEPQSPVLIRLVDSVSSSPAERTTPSTFADFAQPTFALDTSQLSAAAAAGSVPELVRSHRPSPHHHSPHLEHSVRQVLSARPRTATPGSPVPGTRTAPRIKTFASPAAAPTPPPAPPLPSASGILHAGHAPGASGIPHIVHAPGASGIPHTAPLPGSPEETREYAAPAPRHRRRMSWVNPARWRPKSMRKNRSATNIGAISMPQIHMDRAQTDVLAADYHDEEFERLAASAAAPPAHRPGVLRRLFKRHAA
ncbi:hypothetical protein IWQ57_005794, partial [Coemansia nantahalensis]